MLSAKIYKKLITLIFILLWQSPVIFAQSDIDFDHNTSLKNCLTQCDKTYKAEMVGCNMGSLVGADSKPMRDNAASVMCYQKAKESYNNCRQTCQSKEIIIQDKEK
ncbi:hypothetical protein [Thermodesulfovibrio thiophilus]|uniref:hypothetical protein n=1 Tax=Thermodesulfovibrio thiophilus TaxID=340095 RepID=UPI0017F97B3A|nr:hypothetical protein [Thermodesulfovibrio thiophilus]HHW20459.1 hypothetical protein [Thermodesulfovibrio thiophilus]